MHNQLIVLPNKVLEIGKHEHLTLSDWATSELTTSQDRICCIEIEINKRI